MPTVLGYHGCRKEFASAVRLGQISLAEWKPSQNAYDWLGEGIYFWEASRSRAEQWSSERFGDAIDILEAEIDLGVCLSLLEDTYHNDVRATYQHLRKRFRGDGLRLPKNNKKRHDLDNLVINRFATSKEQQGIRFQTVCGVFEEGHRLFPGSAIRSQSHIQIAVRDVRCLRIHDGGG